jgi:hypothetical protein
METPNRYTVTRKVDCTGQHYATGPLTFYEADDLGKAQAEVIARGGELIDHQTKQGWHPDHGWYDVSDYLAAQRA